MLSLLSFCVQRVFRKRLGLDAQIEYLRGLIHRVSRSRPIGKRRVIIHSLVRTYVPSWTMKNQIILHPHQSFAKITPEGFFPPIPWRQVGLVNRYQLLAPCRCHVRVLVTPYRPALTDAVFTLHRTAPSNRAWRAPHACIRSPSCINRLLSTMRTIY
jgi:hypothetical protein